MVNNINYNLNYKPIYENEYKNHIIFKTLDEIIDFYKLFSFSVFQFLSPWVKWILNIDTYTFSSIQWTIESIKILLINWRINDAYSILRKYNDSIIINIFINLYLDDNFSSDNIIVDKIQKWVNWKEKIPDYKFMLNYITSSEKLKDLNNIINKKKYFKIREKCNDNTHYNFFHNFLLNDNEISNTNRVKELNLFLNYFEDLFRLHISYLFYLSDHYMMSSDYIDYMDIGLNPPLWCEKWVSPIVQEIFTNFLVGSTPEIATLIKLKTEMNLN